MSRIIRNSNDISSTMKTWMVGGWMKECKLPDIVHNDGAGILSCHWKHLRNLKTVTYTLSWQGLRDRVGVLNGKINDQTLLKEYYPSCSPSILCLEKWKMIATALSLLLNKLMLAGKGISSKSCLTWHSAPGEWVGNEWAHLLLKILHRKMGVTLFLL